MTTKRRVFISDVHMSTGNFTYNWFKQKDAKSFLAFLQWLNDPKSLINEVILLGDILEEWVYPIYPVGITPPSYKEIIPPPYDQTMMDIQHEILYNLLNLAQKIPVVYINGNHDMTLFNKEFETFRKDAFRGIDFKDTAYEMDGIFAQHGHQYSVYNKGDENAMNKLPLGYYISRLAATVEDKTKLRCRTSEAISTVSRSGTYIAETFIIAEFVNVPLNYLVNQLDGVDDSTSITLNNGSKITIGEVRDKYQKSWEKDEYTLGQMVSSVEIEKLGLGLWGPANQEVNDSRKIIIFGHTHDKTISYLGPKNMDGEIERYDGIYANCGAWCDGNPHTYVLTEYDDNLQVHTVRLRNWDKNNEDEEAYEFPKDEE